MNLWLSPLKTFGDCYIKLYLLVRSDQDGKIGQVTTSAFGDILVISRHSATISGPMAAISLSRNAMNVIKS